MYALMLCVATAAAGINAGWERMPEGGMQYIIQLDPPTLEKLQAGTAIESDIPPNAGEVRSFRIVVNTKKLPRETPLPAATTPKAAEPRAPDHRDSQSVAPAIFVEQQRTAAPADQQQPKKAADPEPEKPPTPWLPLVFTLMGLFASLGANVFLGWVAWDSRRQWRAAQWRCLLRLAHTARRRDLHKIASVATPGNAPAARDRPRAPRPGC